MLKLRKLSLGIILIVVLAAFSLQFSHALAQAPVKYPSAREDISVSPFGGIQITKTLRITNLKNVSISSTTVTLPLDAAGIRVYDDFGTLTFSTTNSSTNKTVSLTFRYSLKGVVGSIEYYDSYSFSVQYSSSSTASLVQTSFGTFRLEYNGSTGVNYQIDNAVVMVSMPEGATFSSMDPAGYVSTSGLAPTAYLNLTDLQGNSSIHFVLNYGYLPVWGAFRPTLWVGIVVAFVSAILLWRKRFKKVEAPRAENVRDREIVVELSNALDEEIAQLNDSEKMEQELDGGHLGKRDYNLRRGTFYETGKTLATSLQRHRKEARQISSQYAGIIDRAEAAETEIASQRVGLSRLRSQFRTGRISRSSFENQAESYRRRMNKAVSMLQAAIV
ncbi:hypothetical protein MUP59_11470, partial [Candidatus Bathyarchaeota archaeon]|nr:hypothetical protein [Candidatus Bathyarchaeota archaeon]